MGNAVPASRTIFGVLLLGLALVRPALAKKPSLDNPPKAPEAPASPAAAAAAPAPTAPAVRAVAFVDHAPDCDPVEAWYGRCVERVDLLDLSPAWREGGNPSSEDRAQWRNLGELYARLWEDIAVRWGVDGDVLADTFGKAGLSRLPEAATLWDATARGHGVTHVLPDHALWLDDPVWRTQASGDSAVVPWFRNLAFSVSPGLPQPSPVALLRGRFATRLAFDGKRHPYDLMDGDTDASGPFHEQMYPFQTAIESGDASLQPLRHFVVPEALKREGIDPNSATAVQIRRDAFAADTFAASTELGGARALAIDEFHRFFHLVGTQIVRFALEEYTPTHMRVLTALIAMDTPPGKVKDAAVTRDVVAASEGQTDDESLIQSLVNEPGPGGSRAFQIDYSQLPNPVVDAWLTRFPEVAAPPQDLLDGLNKDIFVVLSELLRPKAPDLAALDDAGMQAWVETAALPGRAPDVYKHVKRLALQRLVERLPPQERGEVETRLLLDHVELEVSSRFDATPGYRATPQDLESTAAARWKAVLGRHGFSPRPIADGPGAVDPIAICTTKDRKEALTEPVFGAVDLDLLLVAPDGLKTADAVLWAAREQAPFVLVDDPSSARPVADRLVGLPDKQAIYRVRWELWTGWHLLWGVEPIEKGGDAQRLALRTGAVCEDTVLASPDLIPTLAHAALLEGELRSTHAITGLSHKERREIEDRERARRGIVDAPIASADVVVGGLLGKTAKVPDATISVQSSVTAAQEQPDRTDEIASAQANRSGSLWDRAADNRPIAVGEASDPSVYIQGLMRAPLVALAKSNPALAVAVFSTRISKRGEKAWHLRPTSPYALSRTHAGNGEVAVTAAWMEDFQVKPDKPDPPTEALVVPAYRPTASVSAQNPVAHWKRNPKSEFAIDAGLGAFPLRESTFGCSDNADVLASVNALSTVAPCTADAPELTSRTSGALVDLSAPFTWWFLDDPRLALEIGPEFQLTLLPQGEGLIFPESEPDYTWTWSPRAGFLAGFRLALDPAPLRRLGNRTPWGAERPDGSSDLHRVQAGLRFGGLLGPGFNGLELTGMSELWLGFGLYNPRTTAATFTPWHPIAVVGPYLRGQISGVIADGKEPRYYELDRRYELILGVRGQVRLAKSPGKMPEAK